MLKYSVSCLLLMLTTSPGFGQIDSADLRPPRPPKIKKELKEYIPTGVRAGIDLFSIGRSIWEEEKTLREFQIDVDLRHYHLVVDYGTAEINRVDEDFTYTNDGSYFRIGPDVNFLYDTQYKSVLFLGLRYARGTFDDALIFNTEDAFGNTQIIGTNQQASVRWFEITTGTKVRLWKGLFMGYTIRYKFLKEITAGSLIPHDLPGFGVNRENDRDQFGVSYFIYWRFPVRKQPAPQLKL